MLLQSKQRKPTKICLAVEPPAKRKKIGTGKSKILADIVVEEVDFLFGLDGSSEKERTDMKLENALMKQEIADIEQEIADIILENDDMRIEINRLTFGHQHFVGSDENIRFYTGFPSYSTPTNYWGSNNTENRPSTDVKCGPCHKLQPIDEMFLVKYRLRCNI